MELVELYKDLHRPSNKDELAAMPAAPGSPHRIAMDAAGQPAILIRASDKDQLPGHRLAHIEATHARQCFLRRRDGETESGTFSVVLCTAQENQVQQLFITALSPVLELLPTATPVRQIDEALASLFDLFRQLMTPAKESTLGVWGELFTIETSSDPDAMVGAWHQESEDLVDFTTVHEWLEVKTTQTPTRTHEVAKRQVEPPPGTDGTLVSIMTTANAEGRSIKWLMETIETRLTKSGHVDKLRSLVVRALGETWAREVERGFDYNMARHSIRLYPMKSLPKLDTEVPAEISGIRYRLDLHGLKPASTEAIRPPLATLLPFE